MVRQLADGHTLLLIGATATPSTSTDTSTATTQLAAQQQQPHVQRGAACSLQWQEARPGAAAQDLCCLPALLTTPSLQRLVALSEVLSRGPAARGDCCVEPVLCEVAVVRAEVLVQRVHR